MRKFGVAAALAAALAMSSVPTQPARADGGATAIAIIIGVLATSTVVCAAHKQPPGCLVLGPLGILALPAHAVGSIFVKPTAK